MDEKYEIKGEIQMQQIIYDWNMLCGMRDRRNAEIEIGALKLHAACKAKAKTKNNAPEQ